MSVPYRIGQRVYLRPLEKSDINKRYLAWINDSEIGKFLEVNLFPTTKNELLDYYKQIKRNRTNLIFAIVTKDKNRHIGNIKLGDINYIHRYADLGIMIGEKDFLGKGYGREAVLLLLDYAFNRLNLNKVILAVYSNHKIAIKCYSRIGFKIEGRIKDLLYFQGKYVDKVLMGISRSEFNKLYK
jgi:RimJ/RimL family protein N-acetyltransferase